MTNKILFGLGFLMVLLLIWVSSLANTISRKNGEIELLKEKLKTSQSVNEGLRVSVSKVIKYQECTAKILIAPRSLDKAIVGDINDPATALERCRIEFAGTLISENPTSNSKPSPTQSTPHNSTSSQNTQGSGGGQSQPPPPPPPPPTPPQSILPGDQPPILFCLPLSGICI